METSIPQMVRLTKISYLPLSTDSASTVIFPFHPIAIYTNASLLKYLLDPLFINQEAGNWPNSYAIHDIGAAFPNATGTFEHSYTFPATVKD